MIVVIITIIEIIVIVIAITKINVIKKKFSKNWWAKNHDKFICYSVVVC